MFKKFILPALFVLLAFFILRIYQLTTLPVFADEAIYIRWSQVMKAEPTLRFLPLSDGKEPLFMWAMMPVFKVFSDPLFVGRILSVASGFLAALGIVTLAYIFFKSKKIALISFFIYTISPFSLFFDRMALVDSMLSMFGIWTLVFMTLAVKYMRFDMALLAGFSLGGAFLTKSPALFFLLLIPTTILLVDWKKTAKKIQLVKVGWYYLVSWVIGYGFYNILRLGPNFNEISSRNLDYVFPLSHLWQNPKDPFIFHLDRAFEWIRMMGPSLLLLLLIIGIIVSFKKFRKEVLILLAWAFVPIIVQAEFAKVFTARYILFSLPYIFILAAASVNVASVKKTFKYLWLSALAVFIAQALVFDYQLLTNPEVAPLPRSERSGYLEEWTAGTGIKEVADFIKDEQVKNPNEQILIGTEGYFGTLPDGLQIYLNNVPNVTVIGVGLNIGKVPDSLINSYRSGVKTYLVANSSRLNFKKGFEVAGLNVVRTYKKADRPIGKEYVQHGPYDTFYLLEVVGEAK